MMSFLEYSVEVVYILYKQLVLFTFQSVALTCLVPRLPSARMRK